jgi:hypothetical protein
MRCRARGRRAPTAACCWTTGFADVTVAAQTAVFTDPRMLPVITGLADVARRTGAFPAEELDAWVQDQERRARSDRMFLAIPLFVAAGTRR